MRLNKFNIGSIDWNPLIRSIGVCSVGNMEDYQREEQEEHEAIQTDPRYSKWLKEAQEKTRKEAEERRVNQIKVERDFKKFQKLYATKSLSPAKRIYIFGDVFLIAAANVKEARTILFGRLLKDGGYTKEEIVTWLIDKPKVMNFSAGVLYRVPDKAYDADGD